MAGRLAHLRFELTSSTLALKLLYRAVGVSGTARVLFAMGRRERRGEPWRELPPPAGPREAECRAQAGRTILIYEELTKRIGAERALAVMGELVEEAGVLHLQLLLPRLDRAWYAALGDGREAALRELVSQFPNAEIGELEATESTFRYTVTRCELKELAHAVGHPQLAPLFCAGDRTFFERHATDIAFARPETLASGDGCCDFQFRYRGEEPAANEPAAREPADAPQESPA